MPKYSLDDLRAAARDNDSLAEEHGLADYLTRAGLRVPDVMHVVEQRGLRAVIPMTRGAAAAKAMFNPGTPQEYGRPLDLSDVEKKLIPLAQAACLDGLMMGLRVRELTGVPLADNICERCRQPLVGNDRKCGNCGYDNPPRTKPSGP